MISINSSFALNTDLSSHFVSCLNYTKRRVPMSVQWEYNKDDMSKML